MCPKSIARSSKYFVLMLLAGRSDELILADWVGQEKSGRKKGGDRSGSKMVNRVFAIRLGRTLTISLCGLSEPLLTKLCLVLFLEQPQLPLRRTATQSFGNHEHSQALFSPGLTVEENAFLAFSLSWDVFFGKEKLKLGIKMGKYSKKYGHAGILFNSFPN